MPEEEHRLIPRQPFEQKVQVERSGCLPEKLHPSYTRPSALNKLSPRGVGLIMVT